MSKGYLLFAIDTKDIAYSKLATACALSIKLTQPTEFNSIAVITNNTENVDQDLFDHVIPSGDLIGMDARSRAYDLSPYDKTVLLDSDMLILRPLDHYWDILKDQDLFIASSPQNHRGKQFHYGAYRKLFLDNKLPDVYNAWTYFKKSETASKFFNLVKLITDNPRDFTDATLIGNTLDIIPTDEAFALALIILELEDQAIFPEWDFPRITHMKSQVQGWRSNKSDWNEHLRFSIDNFGQVKLGVWAQTDILHYVKKELITDGIIDRLRGAL